MLFSINFYSVFHKFLFCFSEIRVVSTFLKSEFLGRIRPGSLDPPSPASQIDQARRPVPKPARSIESGPQNHESGQGPHAGQVGRVRTHKTARMIKSQTTIECLMKPAASAAPQGGCVWDTLLGAGSGHLIFNRRGVNEMNVHANLEAENDRSTCIGSRISWCLQGTMTMNQTGTLYASATISLLT